MFAAALVSPSKVIEVLRRGSCGCCQTYQVEPEIIVPGAILQLPLLFGKFLLQDNRLTALSFTALLLEKREGVADAAHGFFGEIFNRVVEFSSCGIWLRARFLEVAEKNKKNQVAWKYCTRLPHARKQNALLQRCYVFPQTSHT
jgi:hypothetical protein